MKLPESWGDFLRSLFMRNALLKVVSLVIACLLWAFLMLEKKSEIALSVPIRVENVPEHLVITKPPPPDLRVVVRGTRTQLGALNGALAPYRLDLADSKPGVSSFNVVAQKISLPRGIQVVHVSPAQFTVILDEVIQRRLPINVRFRGNLPDDYKLASYTVEPEEITMAGAQSELAETDYLETEAINLSTLRGNAQMEVSLLLDQYHIVDITTHSVLVTLAIEEVQESRTFRGLEVQVPEGLRLVSKTRPSIRLKGPRRILRTLKTNAIEARLTPPETPVRSRTRLKIEVDVPDGVSVEEIQPETLEVRLQ